ncbi:LysR substrate-binding domain-containing protein [Caulobacter sp. SL161]|uniref:LysR substrate-binding domain-containing protein n=1 Tax=Caulobacter sp. SL161 TaxID=2995156 RepID=UPI0022755023|nr:LysR substrate-binding domain-containing protein [Caulobacter sp. SL161]MCY1646613.1 LysR substrate-binding domain-containing protein [Caulobacter sp. SL161]
MTARLRVLPPFAALRAFEAFGRTGGVRRAAEDLGVSHAIVSRHLRTLEAALGVMLIDRERGVMTPAGVDYFQAVASALDQLNGATVSAMRSAGARLEVWCVPGFASQWLNGHLADFRLANPAVLVDLRPSETAAVITHMQADADIRFVRDADARPPGPEVRALTLARPDMFPVASPALAARLGAGLNRVEDLLAAPLLHEENDADWRAWFAAHGVERPMPAPAARLWQAHLALGAAREGQGVALTNIFLARNDLAAGTLVPLCADGQALRAPIGTYVLKARADRWTSNSLARFRRWLAKACEAEVAATSR